MKKITTIIVLSLLVIFVTLLTIDYNHYSNYVHIEKCRYLFDYDCEVSEYHSPYAFGLVAATSLLGAIFIGMATAWAVKVYRIVKRLFSKFN